MEKGSRSSGRLAPTKGKVVLGVILLLILIVAAALVFIEFRNPKATALVLARVRLVSQRKPQQP
jgi:hypothetical protein